jgi:hypothetical protein
MAVKKMKSDWLAIYSKNLKEFQNEPWLSYQSAPISRHLEARFYRTENGKVITKLYKTICPKSHDIHKRYLEASKRYAQRFMNAFPEYAENPILASERRRAAEGMAVPYRPQMTYRIIGGICRRASR